MDFGAISGGSGGGQSFDGGTQESDSQGGNGSINVGFNAPEFPETFGYSAPVSSGGFLTTNNLLLMAAVGGVIWLAVRKSK